MCVLCNTHWLVHTSLYSLWQQKKIANAAVINFVIIGSDSQISFIKDYRCAQNNRSSRLLDHDTFHNQNHRSLRNVVNGYMFQIGQWLHFSGGSQNHNILWCWLQLRGHKLARWIQNSWEEKNFINCHRFGFAFIRLFFPSQLFCNHVANSCPPDDQSSPVRDFLVSEDFLVFVRLRLSCLSRFAPASSIIDLIIVMMIQRKWPMISFIFHGAFFIFSFFFSNSKTWWLVWDEKW